MKIDYFAQKFMIRRFISILVRKNKRRKGYNELLDFVKITMQEIASIPTSPTKENVILLVRLDMIGDYILGRDAIKLFRNAEKYKTYKIILVGNSFCKDIAETFDKGIIDDFIWVDKVQFSKSSSYRIDLFTQIRTLAPKVAIELERTSDIEYGDLIIHASNAPVRIGSANYYQKDKLNQLSNKFYTKLYERKWDLTHEFDFNQSYINWICNTNIHLSRPIIDYNLLPKIEYNNKYTLLVIGSSKKSKNWPIQNWIQLIKKLQNSNNTDFVLLGGSRELKIAEKIQSKCPNKNIISVVGKTNLLEAFSWIKNASLIVAHDTFAIHAAIAVGNPPTVVLANGEWAFRFSELQNYATNKYEVIYSKIYRDKLQNMNIKDRWFFSVPSIDMTTIKVDEVLQACKNVLD